jgi:hypothetical protein
MCVRTELKAERQERGVTLKSTDREGLGDGHDSESEPRDTGSTSLGMRTPLGREPPGATGDLEVLLTQEEEEEQQQQKKQQRHRLHHSVDNMTRSS